MSEQAIRVGVVGCGNISEAYLQISKRFDVLDIVAVAPTGEIASFCTMWYDDVTRTAYIEPVATVPEHLRRGLARANIMEGLRRLQRMGALRAFVGGYEPGPNALYASSLSPAHDKFVQWIKKW